MGFNPRGLPGLLNEKPFRIPRPLAAGSFIIFRSHYNPIFFNKLVLWGSIWILAVYNKPECQWEEARPLRMALGSPRGRRRSPWGTTLIICGVGGGLSISPHPLKLLQHFHLGQQSLLLHEVLKGKNPLKPEGGFGVETALSFSGKYPLVVKFAVLFFQQILPDQGQLEIFTGFPAQT